MVGILFRFLFWDGLFSGALAVSFRECNFRPGRFGGVISLHFQLVQIRLGPWLIVMVKVGKYTIHGAYGIHNTIYTQITVVLPIFFHLVFNSIQ